MSGLDTHQVLDTVQSEESSSGVHRSMVEEEVRVERMDVDTVTAGLVIKLELVQIQNKARLIHCS